jgi:hypothetical protein
MMIARRRARATRALRIVDRLAMAKAPVLQFELALVAGQDDIGGFVQQGPHAPVATFRFAAEVIDLSGLMPSGNQAEVGADVSRSSDARRIVDCGDKGERGQLTDARDCRTGKYPFCFELNVV